MKYVDEKYSVVTATNVTELIDSVNAKLVRGWALQGGICMYCQTTTGLTVWAQAVILKETGPR